MLANQDAKFQDDKQQRNRDYRWDRWMILESVPDQTLLIQLLFKATNVNSTITDARKFLSEK